MNNKSKKNPIIAIVGKPNVGKSTFFNKLIGQRVSITSEIAGTTRDRILANIGWLDNTLTFIDTAGLDDSQEDGILGQSVKKQVDEAMESADLILFLVDGKDRMDKTDLEIAGKLRKSKKPVLLLVNKAESPKIREILSEYYSLGLGDPWPISAIHGNGVADVLDEIVNVFKNNSEFNLKGSNQVSIIPKVALIGRPNTGKSTLLNQITHSDRMVVSDIPGTTRDAISSKVTLHGKEFILIDTAGIRKSGKIERGIEKFSVLRTIRSITESDLVVVLIDGSEGFTRGDVHLITRALEAGKPVILAINKMDLTNPEYVNINKFSFIRKLPYVYISAKTGKSVEVLIERIGSYFD